MIQPTTVMEGSLDEYDLVSVVQTVGARRHATGVELRDEQGELVGRMLLNAGQIVSAQAEGLSGLEAVRRLIKTPRSRRFYVYRAAEVEHAERVGPVMLVLAQVMAQSPAPNKKGADTTPILLQGSLAEISLRDVAAAVSLGRACVGIEVFSPDARRVGALYLRGGKVLFAAWGRSAGDVALRELFKPRREGRFVMFRSSDARLGEPLADLTDVLFPERKPDRLSAALDHITLDDEDDDEDGVTLVVASASSGSTPSQLPQHGPSKPSPARTISTAGKPSQAPGQVVSSRKPSPPTLPGTGPGQPPRPPSRPSQAPARHTVSKPSQPVGEVARKPSPPATVASKASQPALEAPQTRLPAASASKPSSPVSQQVVSKPSQPALAVARTTQPLLTAALAPPQIAENPQTPSGSRATQPLLPPARKPSSESPHTPSKSGQPPAPQPSQAQAGSDTASSARNVARKSFPPPSDAPPSRSESEVPPAPRFRHSDRPSANPNAGSILLSELGYGARPANLSKAGKIVCVTSPKGGAGRTTVALNLAVSLARRGRQVLLIDADANNLLPSVNAPRRPFFGVADVLNGNAELDQTLLQTRIAGLSLLPSGELSEQTHSHTGWGALLNAVAERFELILIDCAPVLYGATLSALKCATHQLMVVAAEPSARRSCEAFQERIQALLPTPPATLGIVLNMLDYQMRASVQALEQLSLSEFARFVFDIPIPRSPAFMEASARGVPIVHAEAGSAPTISWIFDTLATSLLERLELEHPTFAESPLLA